MTRHFRRSGDVVIAISMHPKTSPPVSKMRESQLWVHIAAASLSLGSVWTWKGTQLLEHAGLVALDPLLDDHRIAHPEEDVGGPSDRLARRRDLPRAALPVRPIRDVVPQPH